MTRAFRRHLFGQRGRDVQEPGLWRYLIDNALGAALARSGTGCALGSMATEVSDHDDRARGTLSAAFQRWEQLLADGLRRMQDSERLRADADADALATGVVAALQGGYLLAQSARDARPMELALDMALDHVRTLLTS